MANPNLLDIFVRKQVLQDIKSYENVKRKRQSLKDYEIYNDRIYQYVYEKLSAQLSPNTADAMPIVANLNVAKRMVDERGSIYIDAPTRSYEDILEEDEAVMKKIYTECGYNTMLSKADKYFCLRAQTFIQVVPKEQTIKLRVLNAHNIDVIPDEQDPEKAYAYIISSFDKSFWLNAEQDGTNQVIADTDDYKARLEKYQVWTNEYTFVMDGLGNVTTEILPNPIEMLPFVDVSKDKDFEFFVRQGQALTDFTVDYNVAWSDLMYTSRMQSYAVGILSGDPNLKPESLIVGPDRMMFLPKNPNNPESTLEFDFKSPNPNIEASLKAIDSLIANFLTTRGADAKAISSNNSGNASYSSALERLMAMIDSYRATKDDFDLFTVVEKKLHKVVVKWISLLSGTDQLIPELWTSQAIVNSKLSIQFVKPEMIETKAEQLDNAKKKIDLGIADKVSVLSEINGISLEAAEEIIEDMQERKIKLMSSMSEEQDIIEDKTEENGNPEA